MRVIRSGYSMTDLTRQWRLSATVPRRIFKGYAQPAAAQICRQHVCDLLLRLVIALHVDELFVGLFVGLSIELPLHRLAY